MSFYETELPDGTGLSDWDLWNSYWTYRAYRDGEPTARGAFARLMCPRLERAALHRGLDLDAPCSPVDLSDHCPGTPPVV